MELKFIVSGVPSGENMWGPQSDSTFLGTLYVTSKVNTKFDIRLNRSGNTIYAYYHYLVYNTINDFDGRAGAYIGLTVRIDAYCVDYLSIYNILDIIYRKKFVGSILKHVSGGRLQFTIPSFDKVGEELNEIEKYIRTSLGNCITNADFKPIPSLPTARANIKLNFDEASEKEVLQAVGQFGQCSLSSEYESRNVGVLLKQEFKRGSDSRNAEIVRLRSEIDGLQSQMQLLQKKEDQEKTKLSSSRAVNPKQDKITAKETTSSERHEHYRNNSRPFASILIAIVSFIIIILCLLHFCNLMDEVDIYEADKSNIISFKPDSTSNDSIKNVENEN